MLNKIIIIKDVSSVSRGRLKWKVNFLSLGGACSTSKQHPWGVVHYNVHRVWLLACSTPSTCMCVCYMAASSATICHVGRGEGNRVVRFQH